MTAAKVSQPPIVRVRFSASGLPRSSFLVHAPGAATMSSPVSKRTICIKRIVIRSLFSSPCIRNSCAPAKVRKNSVFPDSRARSHGTYPSDACKHARPSLLHAHFCLRVLYHNSGSLFVLLDNMIEFAERNCHHKSDKQ